MSKLNPPDLDGTPDSALAYGKWIVRSLADGKITTKEAETFEKLGRLSLAARKQKHAESEMDELRRILTETERNKAEVKELIRKARKEGLQIDNVN